MKNVIDKNQEQQNTPVQKAQNEISTGGTAQLVDNRSSTVSQRKLQDGMHASTDNSKNPIQRKANKTGLPDNLKSGIENLSGYSMDDVKVHYNSSKPAQLQAHAYAQGTDIHLASGQEKHLPHEAWHVVQQKQGRVKPTMQFKGKTNINDDAGLEKEADVMGRESMKSGNGKTSVSSLSDQPSMTRNKTIQRRLYRDYADTVGAYQPQINNNTVANRAELEGLLRIQLLDRIFEPYDFDRIVDIIWNRYGNSVNDHLRMRVVSQVVKEMHKIYRRNRSINFTAFERRLESYEELEETSLINRNSTELILGKYNVTNPKNTPADLDKWWFRGADSYVQIAGDNEAMYFSLGERWGELVNDRDYDLTDDTLFDIFNTYVLDYAVANNITIVFVDHPEEHRGSALYKEWLYLQERHEYNILFANGDGEYIAQRI